jgi:phage baseplate assembly protein W
MANKYRDISLNFNPNPVTGDVSTVSDEKSVNQSLKNLIFLNFYDVPFQPKVGSNVRARLFDMLNSMTADAIKADITDVIENYEPRIEIVTITSKANLAKSGIDVTIKYRLRTTTQEIVLNYFLERII